MLDLGCGWGLESAFLGAGALLTSPPSCLVLAHLGASPPGCLVLAHLGERPELLLTLGPRSGGLHVKPRPLAVAAVQAGLAFVSAICR